MDLPHEILIEIFLKLPTNSIAKFRCLSKTWNTNLSNSQFINSHNKTHKQQNLIFLTRRQSLFIITSPTKTNQSTKQTEFPHNWNKASFSTIIGSCNGLVLLTGGKQKLVLNPITNQNVLLSDSSIGLWKNDSSLRSYGFGYDSLRDDYKILTLCRSVDGECDVLHVYSMRRRVSKIVGSSFFSFPFLSNIVMPFVNDCVHWWSRNGDESGVVCIRAFDLVSEAFKEVLLPNEFELHLLHNVLVICGGCLCILDQSHCSFTSLWIMKEYSVVDSWVRLHVEGSRSRIKPVCFVGDDELLSVGRKCSWGLCDLREGTMKEVVGGGIPSINTFTSWSGFVDTLVSPAQYQMLE